METEEMKRKEFMKLIEFDRWADGKSIIRLVESTRWVDGAVFIKCVMGDVEGVMGK